VQDLKDKLLRAGLVGKKEVREAKVEARRKKKQKGGAKAESDAETEAERERRAKFEKRLEEQAVRAKEVQEHLDAARREGEARGRVRNLIRSHALRKTRGDERPFYFVGRDRRIQRLGTTHEIGDALITGALAIVEVDDDPARDFAIVDRATAERLEALDASRLLFWNKPGASEGELSAQGSGSAPPSAPAAPAPPGTRSGGKP
jgi:uncharacterized protein